MPTYDFRILLDTVDGGKTSYYSSSFVNTDVDLVLSASQVFDRITGSLSCSYQNRTFFSQSESPTEKDINTSYVFKDNLLLSASLSGSLDTGKIQFKATQTEYDSLLRYKFFGEKVCNTLGLPENQWVYVDQFRLAADDEANYFEGNVNANTLYVKNTLSFQNNSSVNSDVPFLIDTGSDRQIKFIDDRDQAVVMSLGYDKDNDVYKLAGSTNRRMFIDSVDTMFINNISGSSLNSTINLPAVVNLQGNNVPQIKLIAGSTKTATIKNLSGRLEIINESDADGFLSGMEFKTAQFDNAIVIDDETQRVGIGDASPSSVLDVDGDLLVQSHITASGDISGSGNVYALLPAYYTIGGNFSTTDAKFLAFGPATATYSEDSDTDDQDTRIITAFNGYVHSVILKSQAAPGSSTVQLYKATSGVDSDATDDNAVVSAITVDMSANHTPYRFSFGTSYPFAAGDAIAFKFNPTNDPDSDIDGQLILMYHVTP